MIGFGEDCVGTKNPGPENRMSLPELGTKIFRVLEKTLSVQSNTGSVLDRNIDERSTPNIKNLAECLIYILSLAEANCEASEIIHDAIVG